MDTQKILGILLTLGLAAVVYHIVTKKEPVQPPNERVHGEFRQTAVWDD